MRGRAIYGQLAAVAGSGLLLIFVPFMPSVWGLPRERVAEMSVFWIGQYLLLFGLESSLPSVVQSCRSGLLSPTGRRIAVYAMASTILSTAACLIVLSILLITSLDGAGMPIDAGFLSNMWSPLRYAIALPLLPTFVCQCLSLGLVRLPASGDQPPLRRGARSILLPLLFFAAALFAGALLLFLVDRWFALFVVVATWLAQWLFIGLTMEQTAFVVRELR